MIKAVLSIAGFDGSGGAGLQADLKTFGAFKCYGTCVITALPIQNTQGVSNVYNIPLKAIEEQLESIFKDIQPDAIKIGMLFNREIINLVAGFLSEKAKHIPIVLDPVMVAKSGHALLLEEAIEMLIERLFPISTIITPNLDEARHILGASIKTESEMRDAAQKLNRYGSKAVLLKGGHLNGKTSNDVLFLDKNFYLLEARRIETKNTHGSGCTLSAAIAAGLAHKKGILESCQKAKSYTTEAIYQFKDSAPGRGQGPLSHFYSFWQHPNQHID